MQLVQSAVNRGNCQHYARDVVQFLSDERCAETLRGDREAESLDSATNRGRIEGSTWFDRVVGGEGQTMTTLMTILVEPTVNGFRCSSSVPFWLTKDTLQVFDMLSLKGAIPFTLESGKPGVSLGDTVDYQAYSGSLQ